MKDKLDNDLKVGDYIGLTNANGTMLVGQIYGFKNSRMHYLKFYPHSGHITQSYTTRYTDCVKLHDTHIPNGMRKSLEDQYNELSRKMERGII